MFKMLIAAIAAVGFSTAFAQGAGTPPPAGDTGAPKAEEKAPEAGKDAKKMEHKAHDHGKMKKEKKKKGEEAH